MTTFEKYRRKIIGTLWGIYCPKHLVKRRPQGYYADKPDICPRCVEERGK